MRKSASHVGQCEGDRRAIRAGVCLAAPLFCRERRGRVRHSLVRHSAVGHCAARLSILAVDGLLAAQERGDGSATRHTLEPNLNKIPIAAHLTILHVSGTVAPISRRDDERAIGIARREDAASRRCLDEGGDPSIPPKNRSCDAPRSHTTSQDMYGRCGDMNEGL